MGRQIPQDQQGMGELLPSCIVLVEGRTLEAKRGSTNKHTWNARAEVIEPAELAGQSLFDRFVIGTDEDPDALKPDTLKASFGMKRMTSMFEAAQIDIRGQDEDLLPGWYNGMRYVASVLLSTQPKLNRDGSENPYGGTEQNNVKRYFAPGEREPMVVPTSGGASAVTGRPAPSAGAKPAAPKTPPPPLVPNTGRAAAPTPQPTPRPKPNAGAGSPKPAANTMKCVAPDCTFEGTVAEFPKHVAEMHPE